MDYQKQVSRITKTVINLSDVDIERIIKEHLQLKGSVEVCFDVSSGGLFRGATVTEEVSETLVE